MPLTNRLLSKDGVLTRASTPPVRGSMATTAPRRSRQGMVATRCSLKSRCRTRSAPGCGVEALEDAQHAAVRIGLHGLVADLPCRLVLVALFDTDLADVYVPR
jgi:hypothetical protein